MNIKRLAVLTILILALIMGCSGTYGTISKQSSADNKMTLEELRENWEEYTVYKSYRWATIPAAIMFDPKDNDKKLVGDSWYLIEEQETLSQSIRDIQDRTDYARVETVKGPDSQVYGYLYYPFYLKVVVKMVDERTLFVGRLPGMGSAP